MHVDTHGVFVDSGGVGGYLVIHIIFGEDGEAYINGIGGREGGGAECNARADGSVGGGDELDGIFYEEGFDRLELRFELRSGNVGLFGGLGSTAEVAGGLGGGD